MTNKEAMSGALRTSTVRAIAAFTEIRRSNVMTLHKLILTATFLSAYGGNGFSGRAGDSRKGGSRSGEPRNFDKRPRRLGKDRVNEWLRVFHLEGIETGQSYLLDVRKKGFQFEPRIVSVFNEITDLDLSFSDN